MECLQIEKMVGNLSLYKGSELSCSGFSCLYKTVN